MGKSLLHFSDIHFGGPQAPHRAEALLAEINRRSPTVVAISGDLTQRARTRQFREARSFLDHISSPLVVVPGNHDVPLWNVYDRFVSPLEKYRRWINDDPNPVFVDDSLAVAGIDTTRSFTIKGGKVGKSYLHEIRSRPLSLPGHLCKVLVAHHPFAPPPGFEREATVEGVARALKTFEECGVEVILTGHLHMTYIADSKDIYPHHKRGMLLVQAGTAASLRGRGSERHKNSFNLLDITDGQIKVTSFEYEEGQREFVARTTYVRERDKLAR
jgi:3',5'-cyclic AMP phosphodiesterase CpdA